MGGFDKVLKSNCKRIIIEGYTSFGIQGINLREEIERFVKEPKKGKFLNILGTVRNLKNGRVEVICNGHDINLLHDQLLQWREEKRFGFKDIKSYQHYDPGAENFTDFTVERSDDLSEMVLALRGAGYRFIESTKALEKIYENLVEKVERGRLLALHYELVYDISQLKNPKDIKDKISLAALNASIENPAIPEEDFVFPLSSILFTLSELKNADVSVLSKFDVDEVKQDMESLDTKICKLLKEKYNVFLGV